MYKHAIVRRPGKNFSNGLTTIDLGFPDLPKALSQHQAYCEVLEKCGLSVEVLPADLEYPDSTFVEDTAVVVPGHAILTRPGAPTRREETVRIRTTLEKYFQQLSSIQSPATLDGGDICEAEGQFFVGISDRTNLDGARQFKQIVEPWGYAVDFINVKEIPGILHLKSGMAYVGDNTMVLIKSMEDYSEFSNYRKIIVAPDDNYAANCVRINDTVIAAHGYPRLTAQLRANDFSVITLEMSEFQKMDGGLSCLSLRF
jgi:dimethylargininase